MKAICPRLVSLSSTVGDTPIYLAASLRSKIAFSAIVPQSLVRWNGYSATRARSGGDLFALDAHCGYSLLAAAAWAELRSAGRALHGDY